MSTHGEEIFKEWAGQHGVKIKRIGETRRKRPDYWLVCAGGATVVEVKDLEPNPVERAFDRELDAKGHALSASIPGDRLRKRIREANQQYKLFSKRGLSCLTFVLNNTRIYALTSCVNVFAAMFGRLSSSVSIDGPEDDVKLVAENGMMTLNWNTSTSAVAVSEWEYTTGYTIIVYHNPHAANPLSPRHVAETPGVRQFRIRREGDRVGGLWVEI
jgi:hypothetical protein